MRKSIDATIPAVSRIDRLPRSLHLFTQHWSSTGSNVQRVTLSTSSSEYQDVLRKFDATMKSRYRMIVRIERIENRRWDKQLTTDLHSPPQRKRSSCFSTSPIEKNISNVTLTLTKGSFFTVVRNRQRRRSSKNVSIAPSLE